ncbi:MAG: mechanosensitive ion channel domain-containing protein [Robiginitalea sp.]|uniref:mechanosensitive ion channel family protein n=1 Tax=Robiginitalea sp. TaxID=1902411 RepID=UPI003C766918
MNTILTNLKDEFLALIPNILISILVLGIGYLLARLVKYGVSRLIGYIGRIAARKFKSIDFKHAGSFIGTAFFWLIILSSILLITDIFGLTVLTNWFERIIQYVPNVLAAILIIFAAIIIGNLAADLIKSVSERFGLEYGPNLGRIAQFLFLLVAIIVAMDQIGIEITFLINIIDIVLAAILFGAALAFSLGARTSISNILAAYYVRKIYKEGDEVQIGDVRGRIIKIDATSVVLDDEKGQVTIPAKEFNETKSFLISKS